MSPKTGTDRASPSDAVWMSDPWRLLSGCHGCRNQPCGRAGRGDGQLPAWAVALALAFYTGRHLPATVWGHRPAAIRRQEPRRKASGKTETPGERQGWDLPGQATCGGVLSLSQAWLPKVPPWEEGRCVCLSSGGRAAVV